MADIYLITGITGFLGCEVARQLLAEGKKVVGLRLPGDKAHLLPKAEYIMGDITKPYTLKKFFEQAEGKEAVVIHCAGVVTVTSQEDQVWNVNVDGTRNIVDFCEKYKVSRLLYVSSVHAIEEKAEGQVVCETKQFSASKVKGIYGKSKAEAAAYVQKASERGLDTVIVHPSGMIGPEDDSGSYMTETIRAFLKGYFPCAIEGGYDFVDVRDVADGILKCIEKGMSGETYILSNEYITIRRMFDILGSVSGVEQRIVINTNSELFYPPRNIRPRGVVFKCTISTNIRHFLIDGWNILYISFWGTAAKRSGLDRFFSA